MSSASHAWCSASARVARPSRSAWASARVSSSLAAASAVGHDRPQVAEVDHLEVALGGLGPVAPLGGAHLRHELLGHLQQRPGRDRRLAGGGPLGVLLLDGLAHGGQPAEHDLLGDGALLLGQRLEQGGAMGLARRAAAWPWGARRRGSGGGSGRVRRGGPVLALGPVARARTAPCARVASRRRRRRSRRRRRRGAAAFAAATVTSGTAVVRGCAWRGWW